MSDLSISKKGLSMIAGFESFAPKAYYYPAGVLTIGYGHTGTNVQGQALQESDTVTQEQAMQLLNEDILWAEKAVNKQSLELSQNQFDALVSFVFNVGANAFAHSTLLKKLKAGDFEGAADEFLRWNKAGGKVLRGLTVRRETERKLFLAPS